MNVRLTHAQVLPTKAGLLIGQNGRCALCRHPISAGDDSCLDHDHTTGVVRDVLCRNCNGIEGKVFNLARRCKRDATPLWWLQQLVEYWQRHAKPQRNLLHPTFKTEVEKQAKRNKVAREKRAAKKQKV